MIVNIWIKHLLVWQLYHFGNWICAFPLEKPTTESDLWREYITKGDISTQSRNEGETFLNGNYLAVSTISSHSEQLSSSKHNANSGNENISNKRTIKVSSLQHSLNDSFNNAIKDINATGDLSRKMYNTPNSYIITTEHELKREDREKSTQNKPVLNVIDFFENKTETFVESNMTSVNQNSTDTLFPNGTDAYQYNVTDHYTTTQPQTYNKADDNNTKIHPTTPGINVENNTTTTKNMRRQQSLKTPKLTTIEQTSLHITPTTAFEIPEHFTGFAQNVPLKPHSTSHKTHHHLNLVPMESSPFGNIIWKDKKYLISVLVPISIGIIGAGCIIGMAYVARYCYKNEHQMQAVRQRIIQSQETNTDNIVLLEDSDDEF